MFPFFFWPLAKCYCKTEPKTKQPVHGCDCSLLRVASSCRVQSCVRLVARLRSAVTSFSNQIHFCVGSFKKKSVWRTVSGRGGRWQTDATQLEKKKKSGQVSVNHLTEYQREVWAQRLFFSPGHKQTVTRWRSHVWTLLWCNCRRRTLDKRQMCGQMTHLMGVRDGRCLVDSSSVLDSLWVWTQNITYTNQWVCLFHSIFSYCFEMFSVCSSLFNWP